MVISFLYACCNCVRHYNFRNAYFLWIPRFHFHVLEHTHNGSRFISWRAPETSPDLLLNTIQIQDHHDVSYEWWCNDFTKSNQKELLERKLLNYSPSNCCLFKFCLYLLYNILSKMATKSTVIVWGKNSEAVTPETPVSFADVMSEELAKDLESK